MLSSIKRVALWTAPLGPGNVSLARVDTPPRYCRPTDGTGCWPTGEEWTAFSDGISGELIVYDDTTVEEAYGSCQAAGFTGTEVLTASAGAGGGLCQMYHDCRFEFCDARLGGDEDAGVETAAQAESHLNLPAAVVMAETVEDIQAAMAFAVEHHLPINVKSSGHSYSGSSTGRHSLLIWTRTLNTNGIEVIQDYRSPSCEDGETYANVAQIGGGNNWGEVYETIGDDFNFVGGFGKTVSAAGGWLQGGGLSSLARKYGYGVDNVVDFDVVLVDGTYLTAVSDCHHPDLFWALRGGGGGTFGVVTAVRTELHPLEPVTEVLISFNFTDFPAVAPALASWTDLWVRESPYLPNEWGGYWSTRFALLYYTGEPAGAQPFLDKLFSWRGNLTNPDELVIVYPRTVAGYAAAWRLGTIPNDQPAGNAEYFMVSRMIPRAQVIADPGAMIAKLTTEANGLAMGGYFLGGATTNADASSSAVGPHARESIWQINLQAFDRETHDKISATLEANFPTAGSGYNHGSKDQPNWTGAFWGANYDRLLSIKDEYDPTRVLNCWHCVGYQGPHADGTITDDVPRPVKVDTGNTTDDGSDMEQPTSAPTDSSSASVAFFWAVIFVAASALLS